LSSTEAKELIRQLADYGCPAVLLSGGEPLLRGDLFELIAEAIKLNLRVVISTNGTLITQEIAARLVDGGVSYAGISLDGPEKVHDKFRNSPGSFVRTMAGIENCQRAGIKTGLRFTITEQNYKYAGDIFEIAGQIFFTPSAGATEHINFSTVLARLMYFFLKHIWHARKNFKITINYRF
jgi:MoaA/NifB/PqqE/SkfB family radical SAM enzyme